MTAINFPSNPQVGDTFLNFAWDGEKWRNAGGRANAVILKDLFEFSVAADDSTLKTVSTGESIKFTGASGITTSSDAEGNITITQGTTSSLVNGDNTVSLGSDGSLTLPYGSPILFGGNNCRIQAAQAFSISSDGGIAVEVTDKQWVFGLDGNLTFPDDTVQSTAWTGVVDYNTLTNKPNLAGTYQFSVAADDSTQRVISTDEVVKFIGAGGITTGSDDEGAITITQGSTDQIVKVAGSFASDLSLIHI